MHRHLVLLLSGLAVSAAAPAPATTPGDDPLKEMLKQSIFGADLNFDAAFMFKERMATPLAYRMQEHLRKGNGELPAAPMTAPERELTARTGITKYAKCVGIKYLWQEGDSLEALADKYCVPFQNLREMNVPYWFTDERDLKVGDTVCVPRVDFHKCGRNLWPFEADKGITFTPPEAFSEKRENASQPVMEECASGKTHVVHKGETLWSIQESYSLKQEQIFALNALNESSVLAVGQVICLPADVVKVRNNGVFHNEADRVQGMEYPPQPQWMTNGGETSTETSWYHKGNWLPMNHNLTQYQQARIDDLKVKVPLNKQ